MIPLRITAEVQSRFAPDLSPDAADAMVLADLADGWTLTHTSASLRSEPGAQGALNLDGRSHQYLARLPDYELPPGWCICPPASTTCSCRDPRAEPYAYKGAPAVVLTKCEPHNRSNGRAVFTGDRYHDAFAAVRRGVRPPGVQPDWHRLMAERWTRAHARVRRARADAGIVALWDDVLDLRQRVARSLARAVPYAAVEVDEVDKSLVFTLRSPNANVALDAVYQLPDADNLELRVVDNRDGLRCESSGDATTIAHYADSLHGEDRQLVLNQQATRRQLMREKYALSDLRTGRAQNSALLELLADPRAAKSDNSLEIDTRPVQQDLNALQRGAVERALRARDLIAVQGPPGTGKTKFTAELVVRHLRMHPGDTVLVASQTHQATDNLLRQILDLERDLPVVRVASKAVAEKIAEDIRPLWLDAAEPWQDEVVVRARRYGRFAGVQLRANGDDPDRTSQLLEIQREYLGTDGPQPTRAERLEKASVIAGTCFEVSRDQDVRAGSYGLAILEEAGKATPAEGVMAMLRAEKVALVGDSRQLPPREDRQLVNVLNQALKNPSAIADASVRARAVPLARALEAMCMRLKHAGCETPKPHTEETLFGYLTRSLPRELVVELTEQYRMFSGIGELVSECFYEGSLRQGRPDEERDPRAAAMSRAHVKLVDVTGSERQRRGTKSKLNRAEAARAARLLMQLDAHARDTPPPADGKPLEVAVITGYAAQMRELRGEVAKLRLPHLAIRFGLVDSFQGDQADVVVFSVVRTEKPGFLQERNRVNVALSRARSLLLVLADVEAATAGRIGDPLQEVVRFVKDRAAAGDRRYAFEPRMQQRQPQR